MRNVCLNVVVVVREANVVTTGSRVARIWLCDVDRVQTYRARGLTFMGFKEAKLVEVRVLLLLLQHT